MWRLAIVAVVAGCEFTGRASTDAGASGSSHDAAGAIDAFDAAASCPSKYTDTLPGSSSRYHLITNGGSGPGQATACALDDTKRTHLISFDSIDEIMAAQTLIDGRTGVADGAVWVGAVQPRNQASPLDGWIDVAGGALISPALWHSNEPNDGDGVENGEEQFVGLAQATTGLIDYPNGFLHGALCECDGRPQSSDATNLIISFF